MTKIVHKESIKHDLDLFKLPKKNFLPMRCGYCCSDHSIQHKNNIYIYIDLFYISIGKLSYHGSMKVGVIIIL